MSFLVPARFASALVARAADAAPLSPADVRAEIGRQLARRQSALVEAMGDAGFKMADAGPYRAPEAAAPWFTCWARTNEVEIPPPRARQSTTNCTSDTQIFVANDLLTGAIQLSHSYMKSASLNDFQFAAYLSQRSAAALSGGWSKKWFTQQRCHSDCQGREEIVEHDCQGELHSRQDQNVHRNLRFVPLTCRFPANVNTGSVDRSMSAGWDQ